MIQSIEGFSDTFQPQSLGQHKAPAQTSIYDEAIEAHCCIALHERPVYQGPTSCPLHRRHSGRRVQWQRRVVLHHAGQLKAGGQLEGPGGYQAMALVIIGPTPVAPDITGVNRAAEEELAHVIQGL